MTLLSLVGLIVFLLIGQLDTSSVKSDVEQAKVRLNQLALQLEIDKNESEAALSGLYRARGDFRDKEEGFLGQIKDLKSLIDGSVPRQTELEQEKDQMIKSLDLKNIDNVHKVLINFCKKYEELCIVKYPDAPLPLEVLKSTGS